MIGLNTHNNKEINQTDKIKLEEKEKLKQKSSDLFSNSDFSHLRKSNLYEIEKPKIDRINSASILAEKAVIEFMNTFCIYLKLIRLVLF